MLKIALDAGHHRYTSGKRCLKTLDPNETREWVLNDRVARLVEELLAGYEDVETLRVDDPTGQKDVSLYVRVKMANEWGADIYISIHHNAGINGGSGGGIVAYCYPTASKASFAWRDELYEALIERTGLRGNRATPKATAELYVTRYTKMPAVLLELGFMDSSIDVPIILTEEFARSCAEAIVEVIVHQEGLAPKTTAPVPTKDTPDAWAQKAWSAAYAAGVMDGTRPCDPVTRQELAQVLFNLGLVR